MAAELGRKMLQENDGLRGMYNELEHEHEKTVKVRKAGLNFNSKFNYPNLTNCTLKNT